MHAPITGAVPVPSDSVQRGAEVFWEWQRLNHRPINGRYVEVVVKNDNYNPSQAVAQCKEMVEKDRVFLLSGLLNPEGKDQVQACARYAASVNVPYVSLGQTKVGLHRLPNYFAFSMSWPAQARLLADFMTARLRARRRNNGIVRFESPNYADTHDAFVASMKRRGSAVSYDRAVSRQSGQTEAQAVVQEMKAMGIENVFVLVSPVWFLQLMKAADTADYHAAWTSLGMTISSQDGVVRMACQGNAAIRGTKVLSPLPAFGDRSEFDRRYSRTMRRIYGEQGDTITWLGWATSKQLARLLDRAGRDLTRARFIRRTERARRVRTGVMPSLNFTPRDHYGANETHVVRASCRHRRWVTRARFKRGF